MKKAFPIVLAAGLCAPAAWGADDCASLEAALRLGLEQRQFDAASGQLDKMASACSADTLKNAQRLYTDSLASQANDWVNQGRVKDADLLLGKAKTLSWAVSSVRGDIAAKAKNWKEAAQQYGLAYELASDPNHVDAKQIPTGILDRLYSLATDAQLIYGKLDASVKRGGQPAGILSSRGFNPQPTALPVRFDTGKASLTPEGQESAEALAAYILGQGPVGKVVLFGYADPRGNPKENRRLSLKRAQAVAAYLKQNQIDAAIETQGKGSAMPPDTLLENLSKEEQWQRWRRVELQIIR